ncbi:MAG: hypothetical protein H6509_06630 [Bryobacterales bacterium]|nr:hypothetical protein [Bryobacterales bacterium]
MFARAILVLVAGLALAGSAAAQTYPLDSAKGFTLHNAKADSVTFQGKKAIKVVSAGEAPQGRGEANRLDHLVISPVTDFSNGTIEVDLAGEPGDAAGGGARGFVGLAFRLQPDNKTYDTFYLRPTNGRADDQERRNHSAQYISHPDWPWFRLRKETPSKYESYVDIEPAKWIHVKVTVDGDKARLYVNGNDQPTLVINDVKSGPDAKGSVALWFEGSTVAHFANLKITKN